MPVIEITPQNVCSRKMYVTTESGIITNVEIVGGCQGNTTGLSRLLVGMSVEEAIKRLEGIECHGSRTKTTSCPDQLAKGLKAN